MLLSLCFATIFLIRDQVLVGESVVRNKAVAKVRLWDCLWACNGCHVGS